MAAWRVACFAFALSVLVITSAQAQTRPAQVDASGRAVLNAQGRRINYSTAPPGQVEPGTAASRAAGSTSAGTGPATVTAGGSRRMAIQSSLTVQALSSSQTPNYVDQWRTRTWGWGIGSLGVWPVDTDNDGKLEFVVNASGSTWSVAAYDPATHGYQIRWQSLATDYYNSPQITALRVVEQGGSKRVWVARSSPGVIQVVNALTRDVVGTLTLPAGESVVDFAIADADNNGSVDVVALSPTAMYFYNPTTLALVRTVPYGGGRITVGNVDSDSSVEIVLDTGKVLQVTPSATTVEWTSPTPFGPDIALADIDGDGRQELVANEGGWYHIKAWDLELHSAKWDHPTSIDVQAVRTADVTGDGVPEVIYGDGQWGAIHALNGATGAELWSIQNPEHGVTDVAVFDADNDGQLEVVWGAGWSSSGPDHLYVYDIATRTQEWASVDVNGPYYALDAGDVDADGKPELVVASYESDSGYGDGLVSIFDARTHVLEWQSASNTFGSQAWTGIHALRLANVDSDSQPEIIVGTDRLYDGALYIIDGKTHAVQGPYIYDSGSPLYSLDVGDLTGDGRPEVVAGNGHAHSGSPGIFINVIDPSTGSLVWKSPSLSGSSGVTETVIADVGSPGIDIVAVGNYVYRVRWSDKQLLSTATANYTSATVADVLGNGQLQIVAGRSDGYLEVLNGDTLASLGTYNVCSTGISALQAHGPKTLAFTCGSKFVLFNLGTQSVVTQTDTGLTSVGDMGSIARTTIDGKSAYLLGGPSAIELLDVSGNSVPTVQAISRSVHWRGSVDLDLTASDPDGDAVSFEFASLPSKGSVSWLDRAAGTLRYTGSSPLKGLDVFRARAYDGFQYSPEQNISLTLTNSAPTASTSALTFHWRGTQSARLGGVDADGDPVSFSISGTSSRGTLRVVNAATGDVSFEPATGGSSASSGASGSDSLAYQVSDGADASAAQPLQITLTNTVPALVAAAYDITPGTSIHSRLNGSDADADSLTYEVTQAATKGTFTLEASTGLFQYAPALGATGTDRVQVSVSDGLERAQPVFIEFRYPASTGEQTGGGANGGSSSGGSSAGSGGGKGGGGGSLEWLSLALFAGVLGWRFRKQAARATRRRTLS